MAAPKGNQFWRLRETHGRPKKITDPHELWERACAYFEYCENNPIIETKESVYQGEVTPIEVQKPRAFLLRALQMQVGINKDTWIALRADKDFSDIIDDIETIIYEQKFTGAAVNIFNSMIIARDLGLKEHTETKHEGNLGLTDMSEAELDRKITELHNAIERSTQD